jgi:WD40 repeat protein
MTLQRITLLRPLLLMVLLCVALMPTNAQIDLDPIHVIDLGVEHPQLSFDDGGDFVVAYGEGAYAVANLRTGALLAYTLDDFDVITGQWLDGADHALLVLRRGDVGEVVLVAPDSQHRTVALDNWVVEAVASPDGAQVLLTLHDGALLLLDVFGANVRSLTLTTVQAGSVWLDEECFYVTWRDDGDVMLGVYDVLGDAPLYAVRLVDVLQGVQDWQAEATGITLTRTETDDDVFLWLEDEAGRVVDFQTSAAQANRNSAWRADRLFHWVRDAQLFGSRILVWAREGDNTSEFVREFTSDKALEDAQWSPDGERFLAYALDDSLIELVVPELPDARWLRMDGDVLGVAWSPDSAEVLAWGVDAPMRTFDGVSGVPVRLFLMEGTPIGATWNDNGRLILAYTGEVGDVPASRETYNASLWTRDRIILATWTHQFPLLGARWSPDEGRIFTWDAQGILRVWLNPT